jgi:mannose-6-phosphate isomerase-like protein (cupin superfamily)
MAGDKARRTLLDPSGCGGHQRRLFGRRIHRNEDEHIIVLEGTARIAVGDKLFDAAAGQVLTLPRKIPHAWGNRSNARLRIAVVAFPGGCEEALRIIARGNAVDLPALAANFGVSSVGPTPF